MAPSDDQKICTKCDLACASFKLLELSVQKHHQPTIQVSIQSASTTATAHQQQPPPTAPTSIQSESTTATAREQQLSNDAVRSQNASGEKRKHESFEIGQKVQFYDFDTDDLAIGTVIKHAKGNAYQVGSNGKCLFLNGSRMTAYKK